MITEKWIYEHSYCGTTSQAVLMWNTSPSLYSWFSPERRYSRWLEVACKLWTSTSTSSFDFTCIACTESSDIPYMIKNIWKWKKLYRVLGLSVREPHVVYLESIAFGFIHNKTIELDCAVTIQTKFVLCIPYFVRSTIGYHSNSWACCLNITCIVH